MLFDNHISNNPEVGDMKNQFLYKFFNLYISPTPYNN